MFSILPCCQVKLVLAVQWLIVIRLMGWCLRPSEIRWLQRHSNNNNRPQRGSQLLKDSHWPDSNPVSGQQCFSPPTSCWSGGQCCPQLESFHTAAAAQMVYLQTLEPAAVTSVCVCVCRKGWGCGGGCGCKEKQFAGRTSQQADQVWWRLLFHAKHPGKQRRPFSKNWMTASCFGTH